jgi:hypothetical protein
LIKDAAEACFIPVCIYNNTSGDADEKVLKSFKEPAWNNPVVRIIDGSKKDLVDRIDKKWTAGALAQAMTEALGKRKREVPPYLALLDAEYRARYQGVRQAAFVMD